MRRKALDPARERETGKSKVARRSPSVGRPGQTRIPKSDAGKTPRIRMSTSGSASFRQDPSRGSGTNVLDGRSSVCKRLGR